MYDIVGYAGMMAFEERTSAIAQALQANIVPGAVVLDIGAGSGTLSFLACRAGAFKVYAVEAEHVIELARETAADNGFLDRVEFIQALTTEIELPEMVDGIVASIHGVLPPFAKSIISILDARDRFLKRGGWIIPARETIWAALAWRRDLHHRFTDVWNNEYGLDFKKARSQAVNSFCAARLSPEDLVVPAQSLAVLRYKQIINHNVSGDVSWLVDQRTKADGICMWFDCETFPGFSFSNSPATREPYVFDHAFFPWPEALELMAGDQVKISVRADFVETDYVWSWDTTVTSLSGGVKARYRQSTFNCAPISAQRLRKRAASFVPDPNEDSRIDYKVLDLMGRNLALDEIARMLLAEFPRKFKDWNAALTRAADLSERYSK